MINQCICAAIKLPDGYIIRGHRHHNCFRTLDDSPRYKETSALSIVQGFVTSENKFVGRYEALDIQQAANIPSSNPIGYIGNQLYSEDLY
jgi:hypothetical protein